MTTVKSCRALSWRYKYEKVEILWIFIAFLLLVSSTEILLLIKEKFGVLPEIYLGIIIVFLCAWLLHCNIHDFLKEDKPLIAIQTSLIISIIPAFVIVILNFLFEKIKTKIYRHLAIIGFAILITATMPFLILGISCYFGLDCI